MIFSWIYFLNDKPTAYYVSELSIKESREVEGGFWLLLIGFMLGYLIADEVMK